MVMVPGAHDESRGIGGDTPSLADRGAAAWVEGEGGAESEGDETPHLDAYEDSSAELHGELHGTRGEGGARRAAIFILSLEESVASSLLRRLSDEELSRIAAEIADLGVVDRDSVGEVIHEFDELETLHNMVREGGLDQAVRLVERSFPAERARRIVQTLEASRQKLPFAFLASVDTEILTASLEDEQPQTLAVILAHMIPEQAAELLERLPVDVRREVLERIASIEGTNAEAVRRLEASLDKQLEGVHLDDGVGEAGGVQAVANILRASSSGGVSFLDDLREERPELAEEVHKHLFVFDDLARLDRGALQTALSDLDVECVALALKNSSETLREKILDNLPRRKADALLQELEELGPVRISEVESARDEVVMTILRLEEEGELFVSGRGREENRIVY